MLSLVCRREVMDAVFLMFSEFRSTCGVLVELIAGVHVGILLRPVVNHPFAYRLHSHRRIVFSSCYRPEFQAAGDPHWSAAVAARQEALQMS